MAYPPMYAQQALGTLVPGQMISVNKFNVEVQRFLSQGGFAHVYLVRTAEPVFNTTHHVLKRIAVVNESMLNEVKKEVDIMRILRGHPNIVYLIDAAWHRMPDNTYEVFILMEFCSGGGIIDMMNRRLRERLTEAEILQIFVDTCEGVAAMHNLRPPLLHRDLKVENILQASEASYKLCDFGSAVPVSPKPLSTTQEMRELEADLNKHTTLQYRAPEMVDVYLRRPVDEKSDVWALGVLLYKLCYYTTPFEEHGVLAILNVQYKFPPYPVYSQQLNALIASMLREHGVHRPTVFEILNTVHQMRGTKSRFIYKIPDRLTSPLSLTVNGSITSASPSKPVQSPSVSKGIQARETVLEAIAPMRRGRPSSPTKIKTSETMFSLNDNVSNNPWGTVKPAKAHKSGLATVSAGNSKSLVDGAIANIDRSKDAWDISYSKGKDSQNPMTSRSVLGNGFGDSFDPSLGFPSTSSAAVTVRKPISSNLVDNKQKSAMSRKPPADAFQSLNMFSSPTSALTLGEAQKAALSGSKPSSSPRHSPQPPNSMSVSPAPSFTTTPPVTLSNLQSSTRRDVSPLLKPKPADQALPAEQRFPSLEELDTNLFSTSSSQVLVSGYSPSKSEPPKLPPRPGTQSEKQAQSSLGNVTGGLRPSSMLGSSLSTNLVRSDGVRSQQVTGTAMREARHRPRKVPTPSQSQNEDEPKGQSDRRPLEVNVGRPTLTRKHRSSVSISQRQKSDTHVINLASPIASTPSELPKDWLTGDEPFALDTAVLRASPEKRTSILASPVPDVIGQQAAQSKSPRKAPRDLLSIDVNSAEKEVTTLTDNWSPLSERKGSSSDSAEEGPEDAVGIIPPRKDLTRNQSAHKGRQSSVHDLVGLWGGSGVAPLAKQAKQTSALVQSLQTNEAPDSAKNMLPPVATTSLEEKSLMKSSRINPSPELKPASTNHIRRPSAPSKKSSATSPAKSRPQSMLILPIQKSKSDGISLSPTSTSLSPPVEPVRSSNRRSSISDIVSRYEAIGIISDKPTAPPTPASKPARLKANNTSILSPTAANLRFPRLSPSNSPSKPSFSSADTSSTLPQREALRPASPKKKENVTPLKEATQSTPITPVQTRNPVVPEKAPVESAAPADTKAEDPRSHSPERPYQGVSRLIDQWQRKSEEADKSSHTGFRGGGSRFRREGVVNK